MKVIFLKTYQSIKLFVHTGMFLGWILEHNLFSEEFEEESLDEIKQV